MAWTAGAARRRRGIVVVAVVAAVAVVGSATAFAVGEVAWLAWLGATGPAEAATAAPDGDHDDPSVPTTGDTEVEPSATEPTPDTAADQGPTSSQVGPKVDEPAGRGGRQEDDTSAGAAAGAADTSPPDTDEETAASADDDESPAPALSVVQTQELLRELRYLVGPADGKAGQQTVAAVMAFQRVHGLQVDGIVGPATTAALLDKPVEPELAGGPADRIEVDLDRQLLHVVESGQRLVTLHVSSGNGQTYTTASGGSARARTPVGNFVIQRRIHGTRISPLGTLYDPLYFHRGFAIHGSPSVPPYPASHGCIRVSRADGTWLIDNIPDGTPVHLSGGEHVFTPSS